MTGSEKSETIATSFELLSDKRKTEVRNLPTKRNQDYQPLADGKTKKELRTNLYLDTAELAKQRKALPTLLTYYSNQLATTNPAIFCYLTKEQKDRLRNQLLFTFYLLYAQYQLDVAEGRNYTLEDHDKVLDRCAKRIEELNGSPNRSEEITCEQILEAKLSASEKCLQFLGMVILAPWFVEKMQQFSAGKTVALKKWMTEINDKRLYWVWGGGMLSSILEMLPNDFFNKQQAQQSLAIPAPITGYMSWVLYYTRFGINLLVLSKHTFEGPWMNSKESEIDPWERFQTQWQQRKFALLNDFIWATANMLCFFWLKGGGMLGYGGNVLTVVLLLMDLSLTIWKYCEESTKHNADILAYIRNKKELQEQQRNLTTEIFAQAAELANSTEDATKCSEIKNKLQELKTQQEDLDAQIKRLGKMQWKAEFDWKYQRYGLFNDIAYALGLMLAFCVVCSFFFPPAAIAPATAMIVGVVGSAMCFVLNVAYAAISGRIDLAKSQQTSIEAKDEYSDLFKAFKKETDENIQKQLYLEMKGFLAESDYQQRLAHFQAIKLIRSVFIDAFIPAVVFASLMFLPLGMGLGVLAAGLVLAMLSNTIINRFEPHPEQLPEFDEAEYKLLQGAEDAAAFEAAVKAPSDKTNIGNGNKKSDTGFFGKPDSSKEGLVPLLYLPSPP